MSLRGGETRLRGMNRLIALLAALAFVWTSAATCAHAMAEAADTPVAWSDLPPCHQAMMAEIQPETDMMVADDADGPACPGGAFCVDCAVSIGLAVFGPETGAPYLAALAPDRLNDAAPASRAGFDPPPPRA